MAAVLVVSLVQVLWVEPLGGTAFSLVYTLVSVVPLAWRRARPEVAAVVGTSVWVLPTQAYLYLGYVVAIVLFFSLGRWAGGVRTSGPVCAWAVGAGTVGTLLGPEDPVPGLFGAWLVVLAPYLVGRLMHVQEREGEERLRAVREEVRGRAVAEERARIVRELHDVVGHEVTLIAIQSEAAVQALALAPERAAEPIAAVRDTAHRAGRELRSILDVLGADEHAVVPDGRGLSELVDRAARLGIPAVLTVSGEPWSDAPRHWLAVNRIVQECLTNAGRHAPGSAVEVGLRWSPHDVVLTVTNDATAESVPGAGLGVPGMAERARSLGGTLDVAQEGGRFTVRARLPAAAEALR